MRKLIDIESWNRKEHYEFYSKFEEPFYGVCIDVDCTKAYNICKENNISFFLYYLHKVMLANNTVEAMRYRISDGKPYIYDQIGSSATISRVDGTFGFSYIEFRENIHEFIEVANAEIDEVRRNGGLFPKKSGIDVFHFSSLPWINFTSVSHARSFTLEDSCPKISMGKMTVKDGKRFMPFSVHVHHALVDGNQLALFLEEVQLMMDAEY